MLGSRWVNFKHFLTYIKYDDVFMKYHSLFAYNEDTNKLGKITLEELEDGMSQLCYPLLKGVAK
jgi:hypothetical protein